MPVENEKSKLIPNEQLLHDIAVTEEEVAHLKEIVDNLTRLQELARNDIPDDFSYANEIMMYSARASARQAFLNLLNALKAERKLE